MFIEISPLIYVLRCIVNKFLSKGIQIPKCFEVEARCFPCRFEGYHKVFGYSNISTLEAEAFGPCPPDNVVPLVLRKLFKFELLCWRYISLEVSNEEVILLILGCERNRISLQAIP
jgi:hypothetical protein